VIVNGNNINRNRFGTNSKFAVDKPCVWLYECLLKFLKCEQPERFDIQPSIASQAKRVDRIKSKQ